MDSRSYLVFRVSGQRFALLTSWVKGVFPLSDLYPVAENRSAVVGTLDFQGQRIPIADSREYFTGSPIECRLSDQIIVIDGRSGLIVSEVEDVIPLAPDETAIDRALLDGWNPRYIEGIARPDEETIFLLDGEIGTAIANFRPTGETELAFLDRCCPGATEPEREVFRQRAERLRGETAEEAIADGDTPWTIVRFQDEFFGISLDNVREFTELKNLYPIPCCPAHIVGQTNLRGEIVTLIDIRPFLDLPVEPVTVGSRVMVIEIDDLVAGLPISEVMDTVYLSGESFPRASESDRDYLRGNFPYGEKNTRLLDLPRLMQSDRLIVNEKV